MNLSIRLPPHPRLADEQVGLIAQANVAARSSGVPCAVAVESEMTVQSPASHGESGRDVVEHPSRVSSVHVHRLTSVDGEIVFDMDPEVVSPGAGGTRMADGVTVEEIALLARAMTYKFAVFQLRMGGAKAGIRPRILDHRNATMRAYIEEITPLDRDEIFFTGPDLGTKHSDFATLEEEEDNRYFDMEIDGVKIHELAAGRGVVAAAETWLSGLEGRTVAIEGFGTAGGGVAREVVRRGGKVVAVSTERGAIADAAGFDIDALFDARSQHGDVFVHQLDYEVHLPRELHELPVDVLVPGARVGVYDAETAKRVQARLIAPVANVPYTREGLDTLRAAGVDALPDFVCNAGTTLVYAAPRGLTAAEVLARSDRLISERIDAARRSRMDPIDYAVTLAETFLATWIPPDQMPDGPALA